MAELVKRIAHYSKNFQSLGLADAFSCLSCLVVNCLGGGPKSLQTNFIGMCTSTIDFVVSRSACFPILKRINSKNMIALTLKLQGSIEYDSLK